MAQVSLTITDHADLDSGLVELVADQIGTSEDGFFTAAQMLAMFLPTAIKQGWFIDKMHDFVDDLIEDQHEAKIAA